MTPPFHATATPGGLALHPGSAPVSPADQDFARPVPVNSPFPTASHEKFAANEVRRKEAALSLPPALVRKPIEPGGPVSPYSIVIDCETLDTDPKAVVLEIAAIAFVRENFTKFAEFETRPSIAEQLAKGRTFTADTIEWHLKKGSLDGYGLHEVPMLRSLTLLDSWIQAINPHTVWIQGTCFDRPLVESLCRMIKIPLPWYFCRSRDARTYFATAFGDEKHPKRPHRAKADAEDTLTSIAHSYLHLKQHGPALP